MVFFDFTKLNMVILTFFILSVYSVGLGYAIEKDADPEDKQIKSLENGLYYGGLAGVFLVVAYIIWHARKMKKQADAMRQK